MSLHINNAQFTLRQAQGELSGDLILSGSKPVRAEPVEARTPKG